jgi:rfaE bifunctional protein kinase chain/domain
MTSPRDPRSDLSDTGDARAPDLDPFDTGRETSERVQLISDLPPPPATPSIKNVAAENLTPEAEVFLRAFRKRYSADGIVASLRGLRRLKVLVLGDTIIDEYHFVRPYGMPTKAPVIAAQFQNAETYAGGVLAVANHVAGYCDDVHLVSVLGADDTKEDFVRANLRPNIRAKLFTQEGTPTTVKRRYLRKFLLQKLFEVSFYDDRPLRPELDAEVCAYLDGILGEYDLVIASDFGHGMITRAMVSLLSQKARYLAVNTQLNSINFGYHVATRYPRADYVCIDEEEARMACRDREGPVEGLLHTLSGALTPKVITVTRGHHGSVTWRPDETFAHVPVLSRQVVDTVGAGDAYLSVAAPCASAGFAPELVGFVGNAVGALAVRIVGNAQPVHPEMLFDFLRSIMK